MRVPEFQGETQQQGLPDVRQRISVGVENFVNATKDSVVGAASEGLSRLSRAMTEIYSARVQEANQARAQDAMNQFQKLQTDRLYGENGAFNVKGAAVFSQPDSVPLAEKVHTDLHQAFSDISARLGNDEQRRLFADRAQPAINQSYLQTVEHETQQYQVYRKTVNQGAIANQIQQSALNYNNPQILQNSVDTIRSANADLAKMEGYPPDYEQAQGVKQVTNALEGAFDAALQQTDHVSAADILKHYAHDLDASALLRMSGRLQAVTDARNAELIGGRVMADFLPKMMTSDMDRAFNVLLDTESQHQQFEADGRVKQNGAAMGMAQIKPDTAKEAAQLAKLGWKPELFSRGRTGNAQQDTEAETYNQQLGKAYFQDQLRKFHGDLGLAYAAYNAGRGKVLGALRKSAADGGAWLDKLPQATQHYVSKNLNAYAAGKGEYQKPSLAEVLSAANAHLDMHYAKTASPGLRKQVLEQVTHAYEIQNQAVRQRDEQGVAEALRQLQVNGGDYSKLPVQVRAAVPPARVNDVMAFGKRLSKGEQPETDWGLYYQLKTDPQVLKNTNLMAVRNRLADTEFKQLTEQQQDKAGYGPTTLRSAQQVLNGFMAQAGINPNPGIADKAGAAKVGRIWAAFTQRLNDFEALNTKKAGEQDVEKIAARMFTRVPVQSLLKGTEDKPAVLVDTDSDRVMVPEAERRMIEAEWRNSRPGQPLSEAVVRNAYLRRKGLM
jgi:soluble lytic murein transglycosylase